MISPSTPSPELTIVMANRNGAAFLQDAVESVLRQSLRNLELIVSDDGSTDESLELLSGIADPRLRVITSEECTGPGAARNRAIDAARGDWLAIVDADDLMHPHRFQKMRGLADSTGLVADNQLFFIDHDQLTGETLFPEDRDVARINADALLATNLAGQPNRLGYLKPLVRRDLLADMRYRPDLRVGEDFDLLVRLSLAGHELTLVPDAMYYYRRRAGSASHRLRPDDIGAMIDALRRLPSQTPSQAQAIDARVAALEKRMALETVVKTIKSRRLGRASWEMAKTPSVFPELCQIAKNKLFKRRAPLPRGQLPRHQQAPATVQWPTVHIRVPTYKRPDLLRRALQSLIAQTEQSWVCDVFDDDPQGSSLSVVNELNDARILYNANPQNLLASKNIDQCFTKLNPRNAEYFCVLEDDNQFLPTHLEDNIRIIEQKGIEVVLRNQFVEHATGTDGAWQSDTGLLNNKFVDGLYEPERFHLALMADMGVSNGGLFWSRHAVSTLEIGVPVSATLQEYLRTFAIVEPIYVALKPTAVWAENGENTTRDLGTSAGWLKRELSLKRSVQILQRLAWRNAGQDVRQEFLQGSGFNYPSSARFTGLVKSHTCFLAGRALSPWETLRLAARGALLRIAGRPEPGFLMFLEKTSGRASKFYSPLSPTSD